MSAKVFLPPYVNYFIVNNFLQIFKSTDNELSEFEDEVDDCNKDPDYIPENQVSLVFNA